MSKRSRARKLARLYRRQRRCQHPGCTEEGTPCRIERWNKEPDEFFCYKHAWQHGYCYCCGEFWGGIEEFEFPSSHKGLCPPCREQIQLDSGELDELEDDPAYDGPSYDPYEVS